mmetsp:Transcript_18919/g.53118  ORF Transcript_18919/g.53118 Transcript_18919/m.53118 type:complete len:263 (+) Transcript_18919:128-916(+)
MVSRIGKLTSLSRIAAKTTRAPRLWHEVNAEGHLVGRLASQISVVLQGKHKPVYEKSADVGDYVVVTNTSRIQFATRNKWKKKVYRWHTGYPGGLREVPAERIHEKDPTKILYNAVYGMLPKNRSRRALMQRLKLYPGVDHPHTAQTEEAVNQTGVLRSNIIFKERRPVQELAAKEKVYSEDDPLPEGLVSAEFVIEDGALYLATDDFHPKNVLVEKRVKGKRSTKARREDKEVKRKAIQSRWGKMTKERDDALRALGNVKE